MREAKRTKRQWNQSPLDEFDPEEVFVNSRRPFVHLPTPVDHQQTLRRPASGCQCSHYNQCPEGPRGSPGR